MLIIQMLMKRATSGALPLAAGGREAPRGDSGRAVLRGIAVGGPWADEERILAGVKKAFLLAAGAALEKYRDRLADQQEIVAALSDIVMECYAIESSLRRVQKAESARGAEVRCGDGGCRPRVLFMMPADRVEIGARKALAAVLEGDMLRTQLAVLRRFLKRDAC